jgi:hypothetical protein
MHPMTAEKHLTREGVSMSRFRIFYVGIAATALTGAFWVLPALAATATQTLTGKVSDAMCGAKHREGVDPAACTRVCVQKGAKYALVVGDKVYTLDTSNQAELNELNKLAWEQARVKGTVNGDTIAVQAVSAAK